MICKRLAIESFAEMLGIFVMMIFSNGSSAQSVIGKGRFGGYLETKLANGIGVMMGICVAGGVSGAHINPAVTFALAVSKKFPWKKVLFYVLAQHLGAFFSSAVVHFIYLESLEAEFGEALHVFGESGTASIHTTFPINGVGHATTFFDQLVGTFLLLICIRAITDQNNMSISKGLSVLYMGLLVTCIGLALGMNCGNAINPARDLGPRLFAYIIGYGEEAFSAFDFWFYIPIIGPYIGGALGSVVYDFSIGSRWED